VTVTYFFGNRKGLGGVWGFGTLFTDTTCIRQKNDLRSKEKT